MTAEVVGASVGDVGNTNAGAPVDRATWHAWRRQGLGASDVAAIVGLSPWATPWSVWATKVGLVDDADGDDDPAEHLDFGRRAETLLADWFHDHTDLHVVGAQMWVQNGDRPWMQATLDGTVIEGPNDTGDTLGVFEAKTDAGTPWDDIPVHYQCQVQWALAVTGLPKAWLAVLHMPAGHPRFRLYELDRSDDDIQLLVDRCGRFWADHVVAGVQPPTDGDHATTVALGHAWAPSGRTAVDVDDLAPLIDELARNRAQLRSLDRLIAADENIVKATLGEATDGYVAGELAVSWRPYERHDLDAKAIRAAHPRIARRFDKVSHPRPFRLHEPRTA